MLGSMEKNGDKNPNWRGGKVSTECPKCRKVLLVYPYKIRDCKPYCSRSCAASNRRGASASNWKGGGIIKNCADCGLEYKIKKSVQKKSRFCSVMCLSNWKSKNKRGENNASWLGGVTPQRQSFYRSREWKQAASAVWTRDCATCQRCKRKKIKKDDKFHIHHIMSFSIKEFRTALSNLVLLCEKCHKFVHSRNNISCEFIIHVTK
jgi:5-methylcytosine-specific restriction endonuclease McrA